MRPRSGRLQHSVLVTCAEARISHIHMPTLVLSTLALLGCVFMVYVLFRWLREELNPKRPVKRVRRTAIDR
jgi:uncharacterized membrane protein